MHRTQAARASGLSFRSLLLVPLAVLALVASAHADVTLKERTVSTGLAGFGNSTSERTMVIAGDKSRVDDQSTYTGRFKTLAGGGKPRASASIVRLDRDLIWSLDMEKKQYTELTFAEMREMTEKGLAQANQEMDKPENQKAKDVQVDYQVDVRKTGKHDRVNGFDAEEYIVTLTATMTDKSAKPDSKDGAASGSYTMKMDEWVAENVPGRDETQAYYRRFAEKMGLDPQMQGVMSGLTGQYRDGLKQMAEKMKEIKGHPVRTTITTQIGPEPTPEQQAQMDKARAEQQEKQAENQKKQEQQGDTQANENAAGSLAHGNIGGALGGLLGHRAGKAAEKKVESGASPSDAGGSPGSGLTITVDVLGITTGPSGASFDIPNGFTKAERRTH